MGIYVNYDQLFGIKIYTFNEDGNSKVLFEIKEDTPLSYDQMCQAYRFYKYGGVCDIDEMYFSVYVECTSTLNIPPINTKMWQKYSLKSFLANFTPLRG